MPITIRMVKIVLPVSGSPHYADTFRMTF